MNDNDFVKQVNARDLEHRIQRIEDELAFPIPPNPHLQQYNHVQYVEPSEQISGFEALVCVSIWLMFIALFIGAMVVEVLK